MLKTDNLTQLIDQVDFEFSTFGNDEENFTGNADSSSDLNIPYTLMEALVAITAVIGNALVIAVFCRERKLRKRTNYYIVSLALADFMVGMFGIPFAILVSSARQILSFYITRYIFSQHLNFYV